MFTAAELVETLETRYRRRFPLHADRAFGEFPPTWRLWFLSMQERAGAVRGALAEDFVAIFAKRPWLKPQGETAAIGRARALVRLFVRQQWGPAPREERGLRRFAATVSALAHVCFLALLVWLAIVAIEHAPKRDEAGEAVQVEFIGEGTPEDTGGGPAQGDDETQPAASVAASSPEATSTDAPTEASPSEQSTEQVAEQAPQPPDAARTPPSEPEPQPQPAEPAPPIAEQPLVVTEVRDSPEEAPVFALPPPRPRTPQTTPRALNEPQLNASAVEIEIREPQPAVRALEHKTTARTPTTPELRERLAEIEIREPLPSVQQARTPPPRTTQPTLRTPTLRSEPGEIAIREPKPAASPKPTQAPETSPGAATPAPRPSAVQTTPGTSPTPSNTTGGWPAPTSAGARPSAANTGVGPAPAPRAGGLPSASRGDDWDDALRNRPGNSTAGRNTGPGVFNSDGSIRMPSTTGQVGGGLPPGTITEDFEKIDRMGTWLKRPPIDYTPSRLERFFVPHESLLQEWVRRNIREVFVPIPGTKKRIVCKVSLLQAGGGCFIDDPNLRDQEAEARPPPDVPFKPGLQEDQGGLTKP